MNSMQTVEGRYAGLDACPVCERPIPADDRSAVLSAIQANEEARAREVERRLTEQHQKELSDVMAEADARVQDAIKAASFRCM